MRVLIVFVGFLATSTVITVLVLAFMRVRANDWRRRGERLIVRFAQIQLDDQWAFVPDNIRYQITDALRAYNEGEPK